MKVVTVCGMGFGTSLMLLMSVKESGRKYGITVEGEATDLGSYKGKSCDLIVASSEIAKQIEADVPVLAITNLLDKAEIEEKIPLFQSVSDRPGRGMGCASGKSGLRYFRMRPAGRSATVLDRRIHREILSGNRIRKSAE